MRIMFHQTGNRFEMTFIADTAEERENLKLGLRACSAQNIAFTGCWLPGDVYTGKVTIASKDPPDESCMFDMQLPTGAK